MLACWIDNPNSEAFQLHIPRIYDYLWLAEDGMKMQVTFWVPLIYYTYSLNWHRWLPQWYGYCIHALIYLDINYLAVIRKFC
jgi:hypothetical protein